MSAFSSQFPEWFQPIGLYVGVSLALFGLFAFIWHLAREQLRDPDGWLFKKLMSVRQKLIPLILGLASLAGLLLLIVAALGAWVYYNSSTQISTAPIVVPLTQVPAKNPLSVKRYTQQDVDRLLEALFDTAKFINDDAGPLHVRIGEFRNNWTADLRKDGPEKYIAKMNAGIHELNHFYVRLGEFIDKKNSYYRDEIRVAMNMDRYPHQIVPSLGTFVEGVNMLPAEFDQKVLGLLNDRFHTFNSQWMLFGEWKQHATENVAKMSSNLRNNGTTGFEKAN